MLSDRPDWCISRQRHWGAPIPLFVNKETGKLHKDTLKIIEKVAEKIEKSGAESWFLSDPVDFLEQKLMNTKK